MGKKKKIEIATKAKEKNIAVYNMSLESYIKKNKIKKKAEKTKLEMAKKEKKK